MIIPVIYPSAAEFWLDGTFRKNIDIFALNSRRYSELPLDYDFYAGKVFYEKLSEILHLPQPIYVVAPDAASRRQGMSFVCKCRPIGLPQNSFVNVGRINASKINIDKRFNAKAEELDDAIINIYVAGPEMCFLQAASQLQFDDLVTLGYNLCARYIPDRSSDYMQRKRDILTTRQTISSFLERIDTFPGLRNAKRAIRFVQDNSNSPMESILGMFSYQPFYLGGYCLGDFKLNDPITMSEAAKEIAGRDSLLGDMVWEKALTAVEYDSNLSHLDPGQHFYDRKRLLAMEMSGYKVIVITANDLKSLENMDKIFVAIRSMLGLRDASRELEKYYDVRKRKFDHLILGKKL